MNRRRGVLRNVDTGRVVAANARIAVSLPEQAIGWIGAPAPGPDCALGLPFCSRVHTIGLTFAISVAYCDRAGNVVRLVRVVAPGRIAPGARGAWIAWEGPAGLFDGEVEQGSTILFEPWIDDNRDKTGQRTSI